MNAKQTNSKKSAPVQNALSNYAAAVHDFDLNDHEARALHEDIIVQGKGTLDNSSPLMYKTYANLAKIAESEGDFNKASDLYQNVLDGMKKKPSNEDGIFKTSVQSQLAEAYLNIGKPERAYAVLSDELRARRRIYGSRLRSVETADCAKRLAEVRNVLVKPGKHVKKSKARKQSRDDDGASIVSNNSDETQASQATASSSGNLSRTTTNASDSMHELLKSVHPALASRVASVRSPPPQQR